MSKFQTNDWVIVLDFSRDRSLEVMMLWDPCKEEFISQLGRIEDVIDHTVTGGSPNDKVYYNVDFGETTCLWPEEYMYRFPGYGCQAKELEFSPVPENETAYCNCHGFVFKDSFEVPPEDAKLQFVIQFGRMRCFLFGGDSPYPTEFIRPKEKKPEPVYRINSMDGRPTCDEVWNDRRNWLL